MDADLDLGVHLEQRDARWLEPPGAHVEGGGPVEGDPARGETHRELAGDGLHLPPERNGARDVQPVGGDALPAVIVPTISGWCLASMRRRVSRSMSGLPDLR